MAGTDEAEARDEHKSIEHYDRDAFERDALALREAFEARDALSAMLLSRRYGPAGTAQAAPAPPPPAMRAEPTPSGIRYALRQPRKALVGVRERMTMRKDRVTGLGYFLRHPRRALLRLVGRDS